ncbi:hypothetical protein [Williamsia sp.]|uniref:hypothetical protein n=1 Tax=Williamsia sp. TaxID=1872085 RepID=UPI001A35C147|nr:hypothetical protein [Williamsia sp.]MBJ7289411.1 hypothetical protein [Williamsia sp.]
MKPFTTRTNPAHSTLVPYETAQRTLELLDKLIETAAVNPSVSVMGARADIGYTASEEADQLADVDHIRTHGGLKLTEALAVLTRGKDNAAVTDEQRYEATAKLLAGNTPNQAKELRRLENQIRFFRSREAAQRLRTLGDDIVTGLLQPWVERVMSELKPLATVLSEAGWEGIYAAQDFQRVNFDADEDLTENIRAHASMPQKVRVHYEILRAQQLTAELEHVALVAHELRDHGFIARAADENFPEACYGWRHIERAPVSRYTAHTPESAALWIAGAITAGAEPAALTAKQAEAARPAPAPTEVKAS